VIFGNIIRAPFSETCSQDMELLRLAVTYYREMKSKGNTMAVKLQDVAQVFASLAAFYVEESIRKSNSGPLNSSSQSNTANSGVGSAMDYNNPYQIGESTFSTEDFPNFEFNFSVENNPLNWFSGPEYMVEPGAFMGVTFGNQGNDPRTLPQMVLGNGDRSSTPINPSEIVRSLAKRGQKRPLESVFDWFSWDSYNAGHPSKYAQYLPGE
jgi:hypothetical protein